MRSSTLRVSLAMSLSLAVSTGVLAKTFLDDFSAMPVGRCYPDGSEVGVWRFVYDGYGCSGFVSSNANTLLSGAPMAAGRRDETHAALVIGPPGAGDFTLDVSAVTTRQLRSGTPPNPWEVAWVLWHYTDDGHFYYFAAKPNGWELGKEDPAYPGAQRFLATGSAPASRSAVASDPREPGRRHHQGIRGRSAEHNSDGPGAAVYLRPYRFVH